MNARLHQALHRATELRAFYVLMFVLLLRAWRFLPQSIYIFIGFVRRRTDNYVTYYFYNQAHWIKG